MDEPTLSLRDEANFLREMSKYPYLPSDDDSRSQLWPSWPRHKAAGGSFSASTLDKMPKAVIDLLAANGSATVERVAVCRTPLSSKYDTVVRNLPGSHVPSDVTLFHLFIILQLSNGRIVRLDKNDLVDVSYLHTTIPQPSQNTRIVLMPSNPTLREFFGNAEQHNPKLWRYDAITANCQVFIIDLLKHNHVIITPDLQQFILQENVVNYFSSVAKKIMKVATDSLNFTRRLFGGRGKFRCGKKK